MFLADIGRLRLCGQSEEALNRLERVLSNMDGEEWVQGRLVQALLNLDGGRRLTAISSVEALAKRHPRDPNVRTLVHHFARLGETGLPSSEPTKIEWVCDQEMDWRHRWKHHNVKIPPSLESEELKLHAWQANAWVGLACEGGLSSKTNKHHHRRLPSALPTGLYTHFSGIVVTVGGMAIDLGLPPSYHHEAAKKAGLIDV